MKKKLLVLLPAMFALVACGSPQPASSSVPASTSEPESSQISLKAFELTKVFATTKEASFDLKTVITLINLQSYSDLKFNTSNPDVATVNEQGIVTRVAYGNATISIWSPKDPISSMVPSTFQMTFAPDEAKLLGKYDNHMDAPEGKTQVYAVLELKANNAFTLTYTAGTVLVGENEYDVEALTANGTYTVDSLYKFTVTTESFPYKKTFSGLMLYDGDTPTLKTKVPVGSEQTSGMCYFEKVNG